MNDARRKATNARLVKNELEQALRSAIILRQFYAHRAALTNYLMTKTDRYATLEDIRALNDDVKSFKSTLAKISAKAKLILDDDLLFRQVLSFPPSEQASRSSVAVLVWPTVFEVWEAAGRHLAKTPQGPLHRFLKLVHAVARLPEPSARTMRDAVDAWKSGGREEWARRAEIQRRMVYGNGIMMREP